MTWNIALARLEGADLSPFSDLRPTLERLIGVFGARGAAALLDIDSGNLSRFRSGNRAPTAEISNRIIGLEAVLQRAVQTFDPTTVYDWLVGSEPFLGHARPVDVLALRGAAAVLEALDAVDSLGYV